MGGTRGIICGAEVNELPRGSDAGEACGGDRSGVSWDVEIVESLRREGEVRLVDGKKSIVRYEKGDISASRTRAEHLWSHLRDCHAVTCEFSCSDKFKDSSGLPHTPLRGPHMSKVYSIPETVASNVSPQSLLKDLLQSQCSLRHPALSLP